MISGSDSVAKYSGGCFSQKSDAANESLRLENVCKLKSLKTPTEFTSTGHFHSSMIESMSFTHSHEEFTFGDEFERIWSSVSVHR